MKLCTVCRNYHPLDHFDKASHEFPTRDGLQLVCRKVTASRDWKLARAEGGKVEIVKKDVR